MYENGKVDDLGLQSTYRLHQCQVQFANNVQEMFEYSVQKQFNNVQKIVYFEFTL